MRLATKRLVVKGACAAAVSCALAVPAFANPNAPAVVNGQANFHVSGKTLTVTNAPGTIINWQGFSIAADELTRFLQQSPVSAVLNRVVGANPSEILGRLQSNGRVFLVNPNGILFGAGSQVDVAGLVASTLNLSNADFLAGRNAFSGGGEGRIANHGEIATATGGKVYLIAPQVENNGIIRAPSGEIVLAAGSTVRLVDANFPSIQVEVSAAGSDIPLGRLDAGGKVFTFLVKQSGVVSASSAGIGAAGRVVLKSAGDIDLAAVSRTEASGATRGAVLLQAARQIAFSGTIDARGSAAAGGSVAVEAPRIVVTYSGAIDVSGERGGRSTLIGTFTHFAGSIDARARGAGDGGFVEVSGRQSLAFTGSVDTRAVAGRTGTLLIDPARIEVVAGSRSMPPALSDGTWAANEDAGTQIVGATELSTLLATTSVTLQATTEVVVAPDAVIEAPVADRTLTLQAPRVLFQGTIRTAAAPVGLRIEATQAQVSQAARLELGGGRLEVEARTAMVEPAQEAARPQTQAAQRRAEVTESPQLAQLRAEVAAEIERENARLAAALSRSCDKAGAPRLGCTVGGPPARRFAFAG
ncbi:MAG: filamentous hemagglutinin N-terminal domain-containing protein [Burkholderiales bacterium]